MGILNKFIWVEECSDSFYKNLKRYRGITIKNPFNSWELNGFFLYLGENSYKTYHVFITL